MATYRTRIESSREPAALFTYMARFSNAAAWDPSVTEAEELQPGPPALGSSYRLVVKSFGRSLPLQYRIIEFDENRRVVLRAENGWLRSTDVIEVAAAAEGRSTLSYDATLSLKGPLAIFSPVLQRPFQRLGDQAAAGLRTALA
jgi:hypothetical protein